MSKAAIIVLAGLLGACSVGADVKVTTAAIGRFHQQLDAGQFAAIYAASSDDMKGSTAADALTDLLVAVHRKLGAFKSGKTVGWNDNQTTTGHFVTISYAANYERGAADENFVYRLSGDHAALAGYHITSNALILN